MDLNRHDVAVALLWTVGDLSRLTALWAITLAGFTPAASTLAVLP